MMPLRIPPRRLLLLLAIAAWVGISLGLIAYEKRLGPQNDDWQLWVAIADALSAGTNIYETGAKVPYVWSPLMAPVMAGAVLIGYWAWLAVHVAVVLLLRNAPLIALVLVSWPFWSDAVGGNVFVFIFVAAAFAVRGSRIGAIASLALFILMPRAVQVPIALWILWTMPDLRVPAAAMIGIHSAIVLTTGLAGDWIAAMADHACRHRTSGPRTSSVCGG